MSRPQVLSIPERLPCHPGFTGEGVVLGFVDSGFYPHPDLVQPTRRIRAFADVTRETPELKDFYAAQPISWHGTMTACAAAGNGYLSGGRYRGLAPDAEVVLIRASSPDKKILGKHVAKAIRFPLRHPQLGVKLLNVSLGIRKDDPDGDDVLAAVEEVSAAGITVFVAAGNDPSAGLTPPASSAHAITVGGVDDHNLPEGAPSLWHGSHGTSRVGLQKPDLLAPANLLPAPMLPGTPVAREAAPLFHLLSVLEEAEVEQQLSKSMGEPYPEADTAGVAKLREAVAARIAYRKYLSADYQHVDGTSFAAPIVMSVAAQMLEANPRLTPTEIRDGLLETAQELPGVASPLQGFGLVRPRAAVEWALARRVSIRPEPV
jgi:serine protease AprX